MARERLKDVPQDPLKHVRMLPLVEEAVQVNQQAFRDNYPGYKESTAEIVRKIYGEQVVVPWNISPSTAANCLRWVGYQQFEYVEAPRTYKQEMGMLVGSAVHRYLLPALRRVGWVEQAIFIDEQKVSGRVDFLMKNFASDMWQIMDLKVTGSYGFRQVKRTGLPDYLKHIEKIYWPAPEARRQGLLYGAAIEKQGKNVAYVNILYLNRDTFEFKECIIPWDARARYDAEKYIAEIGEARVTINSGELPEATVRSRFICKNFCPYITYCDHGQKFARGEIRRKRIVIPGWVKKQAEEEAEERKQKAIESGIVQPELPLEIPEHVEKEEDSSAPPRVVEEENKENVITYNLRDEVVLESDCWDCGSSIIKVCTKIGDTKGGKVTIKVDYNCREDGNLSSKKVTVPKDQVIE